ncbi:MAG: hypothetical protein WD042_05735 [Phycisphaeraceae bacterium]
MFDHFDQLTQFGVAGLMGALWVWERLYSRRRERQLSEAHERLTSDREHLAVLVALVQKNTAAIERFDRTQTQLTRLLERMQDEIDQIAA